MGKVAELKDVVARLCVASLVSIHAGQDRGADISDPEMHPTTVQVEEKGAVEGRHGGSKLSKLLEMCWILHVGPHLNEIGEDALFLLPKVLGGQPREHQIKPIGWVSLQSIQTASSEPVHPTDFIHVDGELASELEALYP